MTTSSAGQSRARQHDRLQRRPTACASGRHRQRHPVNSIHDNRGWASIWGADGVTDNDPVPDSDVGANNPQNFPVITSATKTGPDILVSCD
jgi:hypothetical protein